MFFLKKKINFLCVWLYKPSLKFRLLVTRSRDRPANGGRCCDRKWKNRKERERNRALMWNLFTVPPILSIVVRVLFKSQRTLRESTHFPAATHLLSRPRSFGKSNCWTNDIPTLFAILILCHDWISNAYTSGMCYESTARLVYTYNACRVHVRTRWRHIRAAYPSSCRAPLQSVKEVVTTKTFKLCVLSVNQYCFGVIALHLVALVNVLTFRTGP